MIYEKGIVVDTILQIDDSATITVLKSVILNSKATEESFEKKTIQP